MPTPSEAFLEAHPDERRLPPDGIVHLAFVGQINLEDVRQFDTESRLPSAGLLSFFYNRQLFKSDRGSGECAARDNRFSYYFYGYDNPDNWQVVHSKPTETLERREFPATLHEGIKYKPYGITFRTEQTLPSVETSFLPWPNSDSGLLNVTEQEWGVLCDFGDFRSSLDLHQMLGFADQCSATVDEGSYYWLARPRLFPQSPDWDALSKDERIATARNIRLLLQVANFDYPGADWWGRNGTLYFFIRDTDLDDQDFSKVWGATE
jgi:hypothetical protein